MVTGNVVLHVYCILDDSCIHFHLCGWDIQFTALFNNAQTLVNQQLQYAFHCFQSPKQTSHETEVHWFKMSHVHVHVIDRFRSNLFVSVFFFSWLVSFHHNH